MTRPSAQPNVPGRGIVASYGLRFWALVVLIGVGAGLGAVALTELLHGVQHLAWSYEQGDFLAGVERTSDVHRLLVLIIAGVVAGGGTLLLARLGRGAELSESIWLRDARLPLWRSMAQSIDSMVIVALGASLGREAAPQLLGGAFASEVSTRAGVPQWQRRLLVACGAGAGMAAVYNVPLGGALFALEVLLGTLTLPLVLPALATTTIATAVAWIGLSEGPLYQLGSFAVSGSEIVWALIIGPIAGLAVVAYVKLIVWATAQRPKSARGRALAPVIVLGALGVLAFQYPQLLGNGRDIVQLIFFGQMGAGLVAILLALKPLVTSACLGSGAPGGLFTPTLAYGVLLGGLLGYGWLQIWPGAPLSSYAVIGGAAVLGAAMQGPLAAIVLLLELTHHAGSLIVPVLIAVVEATVLTRLVGSPSIYSARISVPHGELGAAVARAVPGPAAAAETEGSPGDLLPPSIGPPV